MSKIILGGHIHLIMWKDRIPYCGTVKVLKVSEGFNTYVTDSLTETLYTVNVDPLIVFDLDLLKRKFNHLRSEPKDIREVFRDNVPSTAEIRIIQMGDKFRANVSGEWNLFMSVYEVHASPELRII